MSAALPLRVLVVDDYEVVREGLRLTFAGHPWVEVVGVASRGERVGLVNDTRRT
jgi:DNA-binding NarL/FixJ family response regulator